MYIDFIHLFSFNCWIKINVDFKCTLSSKMFSCKFLRFLLVFMIAKNCHQHFNFLHIIIFVIHHLFKRKMVHPQFVFTFQPNCHNPSLGLAIKTRACNEPSHSQGSFHLGSWSPGGLPNVQRTITKAKT